MAGHCQGDRTWTGSGWCRQPAERAQPGRPVHVFLSHRTERGRGTLNNAVNAASYSPNILLRGRCRVPAKSVLKAGRFGYDLVSKAILNRPDDEVARIKERWPGASPGTADCQTLAGGLYVRGKRLCRPLNPPGNVHYRNQEACIFNNAG